MIKEDVTTITKGSKTCERNASEHVTNLAFRVQRMEGFLEQIGTNMGLFNHVPLDAQPGPGGEPQRPGPKLGPHHNGALPKRSVDHGRRRDNDKVPLTCRKYASLLCQR